MAKLTIPEDEVAMVPGAEVKKKKRKATASTESPAIVDGKPKKSKKKVVEADPALANGQASATPLKKKKQKVANGVSETANGHAGESTPTPKSKKQKVCEEPAAEANGTAAADEPVKLDKYRLSEPVKSQLRKKGILDLFPIQSQTLHSALDGYDTVGRARTGQGKTLAFVLPLVEILAKEDGPGAKKHGRSPRVIVLAPTRELAKQVRITLLHWLHRALSIEGPSPANWTLGDFPLLLWLDASEIVAMPERLLPIAIGWSSIMPHHEVRNLVHAESNFLRFLFLLVLPTCPCHHPAELLV